MTERLYYTDSYLREFSANLVETSPDGLTAYLDRTAFYPVSGGQPFDTGSIGGVAVLDVVEEDERIAHRLAAPAAPGPVACLVDWPRRFDHMQQHSGQHLLSAVFAECFRLKTVSFHLGAQTSTIDLQTDSLDPRVAAEAERRANQLVSENRPVSLSFEDAAEAGDLRKASERTGTLRIVSIAGLDRSACGGTHVRATGEIGVVLLRKLEKIRKTVRVEFLCGARAVARAHADFEALNRAAQAFSAPLDEVPALVAAQLDAARADDKARRKLELELAGYRGRELYSICPPGTGGLRRHIERAARGNLEDLRAVAQSFTSQPAAVFLAVLEEPPALLLAASADSGVDAGALLKTALSAAGGRGGGTPRMAQGSVADRAGLDHVVAQVSR
ncbi:MAG: DHHA1 domain-containing protein [Bryobacteraceae bacterium]|jgi:alanyl-tRNA synthetase